MAKCIRCGEEGPHYVPPSFGDTGFFMCDPNDRPKPSRTPENYTMDCRVCREMIRPGEAWQQFENSGYAHSSCVIVDHLTTCAKADAAIVMESGSADDAIETLLAGGWTWDERPTEHVAGKRLRYLRAPEED